MTYVTLLCALRIPRVSAIGTLVANAIKVTVLVTAFWTYYFHDN